MKRKIDPRTAVIILAAGLGTRMKSDMAKVLHKVCGKPMISHVVDMASEVAGENIIVVTGYQSDEVRETVRRSAQVGFAFQEKQLGTGHAVQCAMIELHEEVENVIILCGDVPLLSAITVLRFIESHKKQNNQITVLAVEVENPTGYGRMIVNRDGKLVKIVEEADATLDEKNIKIINSGIYCVERKFLEYSLRMLRTDNAQNEYYLTDIIAIGANENKKIGLFMGKDSDEVVGINCIQDLVEAEKLMKNRLV
jgi:UDP-N-acetylglucosamine diphosphorylase/glucosamine-1-phosphate N-acetyltransferase